MPCSIDEEVIRKAIPPRLSRLEGLHERMPVLFPVSAGMAVFRVVTAAHLPANKACPEVNPSVPCGYALLAQVRFGDGLTLEPSEVITRSRHVIEAAESVAPTAGRGLAQSALRQLNPPEMPLLLRHER